MMLIGAGLLLLGTVALISLPGLESTTPARAGTVIPVKLNFPAPDIEFTDLQGNLVSLSSLRGKIVLVNNWATWCPPCKAEMPTLEAYYKEHGGQDFTLVAIESGDSARNVASFVESFGLSFPVWLDPQGASLQSFSNPALPNSYVIDAEGSVVLGWTGAIDREMLEKYVTPVMEDGS
jgi:thiol-disulfide isomerase/thioredoxin